MSSASTQHLRSPMIVCVYCLKSRPRPAKGEHIVLAGLGGRATIDTVCAPCNQGFGDGLDREFLRNSLIAMDRLLDPEVIDGEGPGPQFAATERGFLDARILNIGRYEALRQLVFLDGKLALFSFVGDSRDLSSLVADFQARCMKARVVVRDVDEFEPARIVARPKGKGSVVRARTDEQARALVQYLQGSSPVVERWIPQTIAPTGIRFSMDVNVPGRCAAKMAFNMATALLGSAAMQSPGFDPVRSYILGNEVRSGAGRNESGEVGPIIDTRFVDYWLSSEVRTRVVHASRWHRIVLHSTGTTLKAQVTLRSGLQEFAVRLGTFPGVRWPKQRLAALWCRSSDDWWVVPGTSPRHFASTSYGRTLQSTETGSSSER